MPSPEWQGKSGLGDYADFVMQTDAALGVVMEALEQTGQADNTLLIFTAVRGCLPTRGFRYGPRSRIRLAGFSHQYTSVPNCLNARSRVTSFIPSSSLWAPASDQTDHDGGLGSCLP